MKNGNASLLRWLHLCLLLLAVLPQLNAASVTVPTSNNSTVTFSITFAVDSGNLTSTATWTYNGAAGWYGLRANVYNAATGSYLNPCGAYNGLLPSDVNPGATYTYTRNYGKPANGRYNVVVGWESCQSVAAGTAIVDTITWDGAAATSDKDSEKSVNVSVTIVNNKNVSQTLTASGGSTNESTVIPALGTKTWAFTAKGPIGTVIALSCGPDTVAWESNYDPIVIANSTATIVRKGRIGEQAQTRHIRVVVVSYSSSIAQITALLDGGAVGTVTAGATGNPANPCVTSYDYELPISASSSMGFFIPAGHTLTQEQELGADVWSYVLTVDKANQTAGASTTITKPASDGTTTVVTTDADGTTTIVRSTPQAGSNTWSTGATSPGSAGVYGNTSTQATSAAAQDSANSLAAIEKNTKDTADAAKRSASIMDAADKDSKQGSAALKTVLGDLQNQGQNAVDFGSSAAEQGKGKAEEAFGHFGAAPTAPTEPGDPGDPTIELNIGPGMTKTLHLNPFSSSGPLGGVMGSAAGFIRRLIAWGIVATFFIWVAGRIREMIARPFATAPFGDSLAQSINSIKVAGFGGGLGYAVKLVAYGLVLTIVLTMPLVIMASITAGLPWTTLVSTWSAGPGSGSGMVSSAISMANQVVPWAMLMAAPVWYFTVEFILFPSQFFWMMFMRFLPL